MYPNCIKNIIESLKNLPGIGEKSAERLAFSILNFDSEKLDFFANSLLEIKNIKRCSVCNNITDSDKCYICDDPNRDKQTIFVVEKPKDIVLFEKMGNYRGLYHVLGGLISPLEGINPEDINLESLISRVLSDNVKEVIVVLKPSIEGETTMQYIKKILDKYDVKVSKIPIGIPMGADIEYIDSMTLELAFDNRKEVV
ncbi:MAG: recombination protein RecR [Acholeplasmatales bacterium]|nr:recombination protein RecR [Acholeplasmatales bacterium]